MSDPVEDLLQAARAAQVKDLPRSGMSREQLRQRKLYIGASEAPAAVGQSSFMTPYELWAEKTSEEILERTGPRLEWGHRLERPILERYDEDSDEAVTYPCESVVHPDYPWMRATPDALTPTRVVQAKNVGLGQSREWGEEGTDQVPIMYLIQVTHEMLCTGRRLADLPILIGGNEYRVYCVKLDDELAALLIEREREFWQHVQNRTPPEVVTIADAQARWPKDTGVSVVASPEIADAVVRLREVRDEQEKLNADEDALQLAIRTCMAEATTLTDSSGQTLATWKAQVRSQLDFQGLKKAHPAIYDAFTQKIPTRVFRLAKGKQT